MNGLRDMLYGPQGGSSLAAGSGPSPNVGANFGFNIGDETLRIQLAISGLVVLAVAVLVYMHRSGYRFSVNV